MDKVNLGPGTFTLVLNFTLVLPLPQPWRLSKELTAELLGCTFWESHEWL